MEQVYGKNKERFDIVAQLVSERKRQGVSQAELACRIGTQKPNISRFESGTYNPTLAFLRKVAEGLGMEMEIRLVSGQEEESLYLREEIVPYVGSEDFFQRISCMIENSKEATMRVVNSRMADLYWQIGRAIQSEILNHEKPEYGKSVMTDLSRRLTQKYGKGFSQRNLFNMVKLHEVFSDIQILHTVCAKLPWSHIRKLMYIEDPLKREFYFTMAVHERWSVRVLTERINSMLYERTVLSRKPAQTIMNDLKALQNEKTMLVDMFFRDPYVLDFLALRDTFSEKDLESSILNELERFVLEMGRDFAFMGRQVRISIGEKDYHIDLLFYHRRLRRLVLVELKLGEFLPEHKVQVELYLHWLEKNEMGEGEEPPIGIILCAEKNQEIVELMELDQGGIHVAEYLTVLPPKEVWQEKLRQSVLAAREMLAQREE